MTLVAACTPTHPCGVCDFCQDDYPLGPEPDGPTDAYELFKSRLLTTTQIGELPAPEWLVTDWLMRDTLALLYGASGTYKTFLALDLALHLATGSWWHDHPIDRPGKVLYVIAEGARGIGRRLDAWRAHARIHDLDQDGFQPITWLPGAIYLNDLESAALTARACEDLQPDLVVIDTYARCTLGAEENSAKDTGVIVAALDRIRKAAGGAAVLAVHHTGKDTANGARGSSALKAAMDTELEVVGGDQRITLRVTKQKDGAEPPPKQLAPRLLADSLVLVPAAMVQAQAGLSPSASVAFRVLGEIDVPTGVASGIWKTSCGAEVHERSFYRAQKELLDAGLVENVSVSSVPRYRVNHGGSEVEEEG